MLTSEILQRAKARLIKRGWCQETLIDRIGRVCALGAFTEPHHDALDALDLLSRSATGKPDACGVISIWNDAPERTVQDVLDAFDAAIAIALQQEATAKELEAMTQ